MGDIPGLARTGSRDLLNPRKLRVEKLVELGRWNDWRSDDGHLEEALSNNSSSTERRLKGESMELKR